MGTSIVAFEMRGALRLALARNSGRAMRLLTGVFLLALGSTGATASAAPAPASNFPVNSASSTLSLGWQDAAWIPLAGLAQIPAQWLYNSMPIADTANLRRDDLPIYDRWVAGTYRPTAATLSDILIVPFCALPTALSAFDSWRMGTGWRPVATDFVVFSEALAISSALDLAARSTRMHPRPLVYGTDTPASERGSREASGSFYSGHANAAFLAAVYLSYTYPQRHPEFRGQAWLWTGSLAAAAVIASLRVAAGKHFPSDIIVGAAAGALFGWGFPYMHQRSRRNTQDTGGGATSPQSPAAALSAPRMNMGWDELGWHPQLVWTF